MNIELNNFKTTYKFKFNENCYIRISRKTLLIMITLNMVRKVVKRIYVRTCRKFRFDNISLPITNQSHAM